MSLRKRPNKIFWWVFGVHASALFLLLVIPMLKSCIHRKPKEFVQFVDLVSEAPSTVAAPQPEPEKPTPTPEPEKPKWKPAEVIPQNKRVTRQTTTPTPQPAAQPKPDLSELKKVLGSSAGTPSEFAAYYTTLFARFYSVWQVPAGAAYGTSAQASITVEADGSVSARRLIRPSGNSAFDQSVQNALNTVNQLPRPPPNLPNRTITVDFVPR